MTAPSPGERPTGWARLFGWLLENRVLAAGLAALLVVAGGVVSPFDHGLGAFPRDPVAVDALPDTGENQQIVFTEWPGRSPRDVEDQVTYPLTTALLGIPGVQTIRSSSALGFSTLYIIFDDGVDFYWARSRVLEKLAALPAGTVPASVSPTLGPDATALGQVFWYTLEGHAPDGTLVGGWDPDELRAVQDWTVRTALQSVRGVSEVSSVGGFVREVQVDVDPESMEAAGVTLMQVADAVRRSNLDVGARTLEINGVEYVVRGVGFLEGLADLEEAVVVAREDTPVRIADVARVSVGPALRRGALDDAGAPAVGGVVVARHLENPREVLAAVKDRIAEIQPGLPRRTLEDGTVSQVTLVPFYDRSELIDETLGTLSSALFQQMLITLLVVLVLLRRVRSAMLVSLLLPLGVLGTFIVMKGVGIGANIMALGGVAIAIGSMVDIGIVFVENMEQRLTSAPPDRRKEAIRDAASEVAPAVLTSVATTVVGFLPVFALTDAEWRLFAPLAATKTAAMVVAFVLAVLVLPVGVLLLSRKEDAGPPAVSKRRRTAHGLLVGAVAVALIADWMPLGDEAGWVWNVLFAGLLLGGVLRGFQAFEASYPRLLRSVLANKARFGTLPVGLVAAGLVVWLGVPGCTAWMPEAVRRSAPVQAAGQVLPGLARAYMPAFDEGAFLYMPSTMPHASIGEAQRLLSTLDAALAEIPEVDRVVGKLGRVDSALDPAPISMIETVVTTKPEFATLEDGTRVRQWRDHIRSSADLWEEIAAAAALPGLTGAPVLMPISARIVMLQSGMRGPMGVRIQGPDLETLESFGLEVESLLKQVPAVRSEAVFADRVVGKPYLEVRLDREAIGRVGLSVVDVQQVLQVALGGEVLTHTVEGRARSPVRVRYAREDRDSLEALARVLVPTPGGASLPLAQLADIVFVPGPQVIHSENTFLTSTVLFDRVASVSEGAAVEEAQAHLARAIANGELRVPDGVSYRFAGTHENQIRSEKRLLLLVPIALGVVFVLLVLQFKRARTAAILASGVAVALSGGFLVLWLYGQPWFLNVSLGGVSLQDRFHVGAVPLSVATWVGLIALIGLATDDGVVMVTYLRQSFRRSPPDSVAAVRMRTVEAGVRRIRACLMTTATTLLALLPVVGSSGRGADVMVSLALPVLGGMTVALVTLFVVPVLWCACEERSLGDGS